MWLAMALAIYRICHVPPNMNRIWMLTGPQRIRNRKPDGWIVTGPVWSVPHACYSFIACPFTPAAIMCVFHECFARPTTILGKRRPTISLQPTRIKSNLNEFIFPLQDVHSHTLKWARVLKSTSTNNSSTIVTWPQPRINTEMYLKYFYIVLCLLGPMIK